MLLLGGIALLLIALSERVPALQGLQSKLSVIATPFYWLTSLPERAMPAASDITRKRADILAENEQLQAQALVLNAKVQKLAALRAENMRLRELLNSSTLVEESVQVAEVIGVSSDPTRHNVVIAMGEGDGVYVGQPVIDANGLFGQVIEVGPLHSRAILITDSAHALSVQINRNGVRAIAEGSGRINELNLMHVPATTDIRIDDELFTSGLAGHFPAGYPVARVVEVKADPGQPFLTVKARPYAALDRARHVLLIFSENSGASRLRSNLANPVVTNPTNTPPNSSENTALENTPASEPSATDTEGSF